MPFCTVCDSTTDKFRFRRNNFKENESKTLTRKEHTQRELFEHFAIDDRNCFLNNCSITITKTDGSNPKSRVLKKGFKNWCTLWIKYFRMIVTPARFYTFFRWWSLVYVKRILDLSKSCLYVL